MSSERGMNPFVKAFIYFLRSLRPSKIIEPKGKLVGTDHLGNKYFEVNQANVRTKRYFKPPVFDKWDEPLPTEWTAWLEWRRSNPPTPEEVQGNLERIQRLKMKFPPKPPPKTSIAEALKENKFPSFHEYEQTPGSKYKDSK